MEWLSKGREPLKCGHTQTTLKHLSEDMNELYTTTVAALTKWFELESKPGVHKVKFQRRNKRCREGWADFMDDL